MVAKENTLAVKTDKIENEHSAETPEAKADDWGTAALRKKRARGGKVMGAAPKMRMDRKPRHSDEAEDRALVKKMVKPEDLRKGYASGGAVKGKKGTTVNVIIAPQGGAGGTPPGAMPPPSGPMQPPPGMIPPPGAMPPKPPMAGAPGLPPGAGAPPMMARKDGGRTPDYPIKDGAGSGEGRLEKERAYGANARTGEGK